MEQQRAASDADRATLQKKLDELSGKLQHAGGKAGGADIAKGNRAAIWLVAVHAPSGQEEGFCSAFARASASGPPSARPWAASSTRLQRVASNPAWSSAAER